MIARVALCCAVMTMMLWFTSHDAGWFPDETANRVSAGMNVPLCHAAFFSLNGAVSMSTKLGTMESYEPHRPYLIWQEAEDSHFCGFGCYSTPAEGSGAGCSAFVDWRLDHFRAGLDFPYWLMATIWIVIYVNARRSWRVTIGDFLVVMFAVALCLATLMARVGLLVSLPLTLLTLFVVAAFFVQSLRNFFRSPEPWWPLLLRENAQA